MANRLKERYESEIRPSLQEKFAYKNVMEIPKLEKVVINMGLGENHWDVIIFVIHNS